MPKDLRRFRTAALAAVLGLASAGAPAADARGGDEHVRDRPPTFEVTPFVGYRFGGDFDLDSTTGGDAVNVDLNDDASYGIGLGIYRDATSFYEFFYSRQDADLDTGGTSLGSVDLKTEYLHFGGTLLYPLERWLVPYLSLTIGATRFDPQSGGGYDSETKFSASLGGGLRFPITENFATTLALRGYFTFVDSDTEIFCIGSGGVDCLLRTSGSTFTQGEAQLGFSFTF